MRPFKMLLPHRCHNLKMTLAASQDISLRIRNVIVVSFSRGSSAEQDFQQWPS